MKKILLALALSTIFFSCQTSMGKTKKSNNKKALVKENSVQLNETEINSIIKDSQLGFYPITIDGIPKKLFSDINGDGIDDIIVIYAKGESLNSGELNLLASKSRLYNDNIEPSQFSLIAFANLGNDLKEKTTILLGSYKTIENIKMLRKSDSPEKPNLISLSFADPQGETTKIISFKDFNLSSVLELKKDVTSGFYLKDINRDGTPEIIKYQQVVTKNSGYDTSLSLYEWNGQKFSFTSQKYIIRELNQFLYGIKKAIENNDRVALINQAFPHLEARKYNKEKLSMKEILKLIFTPADTQTKPIRVPKEILFAELQENPFHLHNRQKKHQVEIYCRLIYGNLSSDFYKATIVLNDNPFTKKQYYFTY